MHPAIVKSCVHWKTQRHQFGLRHRHSHGRVCSGINRAIGIGEADDHSPGGGVLCQPGQRMTNLRRLNLLPPEPLIERLQSPMLDDSLGGATRESIPARNGSDR